jgi:hypothetical protein
MTAKNMIELVQQHHPHMGETEILILLNDAKDEFCERTEITKSLSSTFNTVAGQLHYDFLLAGDTPTTGGVLKINKVWVGSSGNSLLASRLQGPLKIKDLL